MSFNASHFLGKKMLKMAEHGAIAVNGDLYEYSQQGLVSISGELAVRATKLICCENRFKKN